MASARSLLKRRQRTGGSAALLLFTGGVVALPSLFAPARRLVNFVPLPHGATPPAEPLDADRGQLSRRQSMLAAATAPVIAAAAGVAPSALAQESAFVMPNDMNVSPQGSKVNRIVISIRDDDSLQQEVKFWNEGVGMKVLNKAPGVATVGFSDDFGLELRVNKSTIGLPLPNLLNYDVMQPTVDSMYFLQFGIQAKVQTAFKGIQATGGNTMIGDNLYLDAVSPRGVPIRLIRRPDEAEPRAEMIAFHLEAPAFDPVKKFYQRVLGLKETRYPPEDPDVTKQSILLQSEMPGGPKVLLSPVADDRVKERWLDYYDGVRISVTNPDKTEATAKQVAADVLEEEEAKIKELQRLVDEAQKKGDTSKSIADYTKALESKLRPGATRARPSVFPRTEGGKTVTINDGVGNMIFLSTNA